ncbi:MAG: L,D-transpeptidase family protein [Hyphomonadaceae bacterium]
MRNRFAAHADGRIVWPSGSAPCVFGRGGCVPAANKREGDGATPLGAWPIREVFFRPDRVAPPATGLPVTALSRDMGWCDAPGRPDYNRRVRLPFPDSHEVLWREDGLYDLLAVLGYNDDPPAPGLGSAIFLHLAAPDMTPTEGCVATDLASLRALLAEAAPGDVLDIVEAPQRQIDIPRAQG